MGSAIDGTTQPRRTGGQGRLEQAMIEQVNLSAPQSGAEALKALGSAFPESPLSQRVAALVTLARRQNGLGVPR
jgi:hypothetical protein